MTGPRRVPPVPPLLVVGVVIGVIASVLVAGGVAALRREPDPPATPVVGADAPGTVVTGTVPRATDAPSDDDKDDDMADDAEEAAVTAPSGAGPGTLPSGQLVTCPSPSKRVGTVEELMAALATANPGDSIEIRDGTYEGSFVATRSGTAEKPIFLCGSPGAVLDGGGIRKGYVLHLKGVQHWRVVGFTLRNGQKGLVADGTTSSVIQQLTVEDLGDEAIHLRAGSSANAVLGNTVRRTGQRRDKFGEGIYIGSATSNWGTYSGGQPDRSDHNLVEGNTISQTSSESIDVKEGTTGGRVVGNTMDGTGMVGADSLIDVKGNDWVIEGNTGRHGPKEGIQTHRILEGWGSRNTFRDNTIDVDSGGNHFYIHDPTQTQNKVLCSNRTGDGGPVRSNVGCSP